MYFERDDDGFSDQSDPTDYTRLPDSRRLWKGYYRFNFSVLPSGVGLGWLAGSEDENDRDSNDFLLALRSNPHNIGRHHARFAFHSDKGCLLVYAGRELLDIELLLEHSN